MNNATKLQAQMAELAGKFIERTRGEASTIRELIERFDGADAQAVEQLGYLVHRIHGGGATFGFDALSEHAGEMERLIEPAVRDGASLDAQTIERLRDYGRRLEEAASAAAPSGNSK